MERNKIQEGEQFGFWTVIRPAGQDKHKNYLYLVKCKCGNTSKVMSSSLKKGKSTRCRSCAFYLSDRSKTTKLIEPTKPVVITNKEDSTKGYACDICRHVSIKIDIIRRDDLK